MVINKNSMGYELNKKQRKKLIYLYEEFLKDPEKEFMKTSSWHFVSPATHLYTNPVKIAMNASLKIFRGEMPKERVKEILKELKKEDEEDK